MYEEYFGLSGAPFKLNPDPKFFFGSRSHNKAMAYLHYGLKQAEGFIVITGPVGAGKTMLISHLLDQLSTSNIVAAQLLTSNIEPDDLVSHILSAFRIEPEGEGRTGQFEAFEDYLFDQLDRGRRVLLIMDEAQNLPHKTLEELRMLSNIDYDGTPLFQVFLVGQPDFRATLDSKKLEQLKQRVIASYHLEGLTAEEAREYILHRLSVVGWKDDPTFTEEAFVAIYAETHGRPRRINTLANRLMLYCALEKRHAVTGEVVKAVIEELKDEKLSGEETAAPAEAKKVDMPPVRTVSAANGKSAGKKKPAKTKPAAPSAGGSVFDRLRAKRGGHVEETHADAPEDATLSDVAAAIADAAAGEPREFPADPETPEDALNARAEWRNSVLRTISETRDELKEAHSSVNRLRESLEDMRKRRAEHRAQVAASLAEAENLLSEIRNAQG